ncbi:MAG: histidine--tRNA ligase [Candidatus Omnitrophota bacterium]
MLYRRVAGTKDILPEEVCFWQKIEEASRRIFSLYNYLEIRAPLIEEEPLFNRSLGPSSEIVQKQMFLMKNKDETYVLRPEGTASIVRAYVENHLDKALGFAKFYYLGPMFRLERPQKGRLRQFHHIGCEAIGSYDPDVDVEIISLAGNLLKGFSISGYVIKLNSLGCARDKKELSSILHKGLKDKLSKLCEDCQKRFKANALRILDCKNETCQEVVRELDIKDSYLCPDCLKHFNQVKEGLDSLKIKYTVAPYLVRGLDYYTRTVFEITHKDLGAQDALGAGGRYDNLVKELGGPDVGAMGFAFGVERLLLVQGACLVGRQARCEVQGKSLTYLISLGQEAEREGIKILENLRKNGIACDTDYESKSLKGAMRRANDLNARFVLILGEDELKKNVVTVKDMTSGEQKEVTQQELLKEL